MASSSSSSSPSSSKLKIAGAWSGALEVELDTWTLSMLRDEVRRRSGAGEGRSVNLICGGKVLKESDGAQPLGRLGLKNNSKVLATVVSPDKGKALDEELKSEAERSLTLTRLKAAAVALTERHADYGSLPVEDFNLELEDQSGQKLKLGSETDQKGAMMGVMLHTNGKSLLEKEKYKDALDVLLMAEESFSLCDPKLIEMIDNFPILQLDIVWCYFMLRDISCLSVAGMRLAKARKGLERSHGKDSSRFRALQESCHQDLAIYLRLELLEGVAAYHSGNLEKSRKALNSAQSKFNQFQVPDEALSQLMNMGYKEKSAKRALRMTGLDMESAVDFLVEDQAKRIRRREEDRQRQAEILEQKMYGLTPMKKAVDIRRLNELVSIGFERVLVAEALRVNENDTQLALDLLTDPVMNCELQSKLESRRAQLAAAALQEHLLHGTGGDALQERFLRGTAGGVALQEHLLRGTTGGAALQERLLRGTAGGGAAESDASGAEDAASGGEDARSRRDVEMENELVHKLEGDQLADYDIEVTKEGEAIAEYLALLDSSVQVANVSSL